MSPGWLWALLHLWTLTSAPDDVFYFVSRFVNFSQLRGTLFFPPFFTFFFLNTPTSACSQLPKRSKKKEINKRRKKNRVEEAGTEMKSSTQWNRRVGGWRDGGVKARGRRKQRKALTKIERGLEDFTNPEGNVRDISVIIIPAFCSGYLEDLCCLGTTKKPNQWCFLGGNLLNLNKCNQKLRPVPEVHLQQENRAIQTFK